MDFRVLIDNKVQVTATVEKITKSSHSNDLVLVLRDTHVNGEHFRDHTWTKMTKRLSDLKVGDKFDAGATLIEYPSVEGKKLGLKSFRSVEVSPVK